MGKLEILLSLVFSARLSFEEDTSISKFSAICWHLDIPGFSYMPCEVCCVKLWLFKGILRVWSVKIFTYMYVTYMTIIGDFEMEHHCMFSVSMTWWVCMLCFRCGQYRYILYCGSTSDLVLCKDQMVVNFWIFWWWELGVDNRWWYCQGLCVWPSS
jgi:hypothetical protein